MRQRCRLHGTTRTGRLLPSQGSLRRRVHGAEGSARSRRSAPAGYRRAQCCRLAHTRAVTARADGGDQAPIQREKPQPKRVETKPIDDCPSYGVPVEARYVERDVLHSVRYRSDIIRRDEQTAAAIDEFDWSRAVGSHYGKACGHRFRNYEPERLVATRVDKEVRRREEVGELHLGVRAGELDSPVQRGVASMNALIACRSGPSPAIVSVQSGRRAAIDANASATRRPPLYSSNRPAKVTR